MKFKITTDRLSGKYELGEVVEVTSEDKSPLTSIMNSLVEQGEAVIEGDKPARKKKRIIKKKVKKSKK